MAKDNKHIHYETRKDTCGIRSSRPLGDPYDYHIQPGESNSKANN